MVTARPTPSTASSTTEWLFEHYLNSTTKPPTPVVPANDVGDFAECIVPKRSSKKQPPASPRTTKRRSDPKTTGKRTPTIPAQPQELLSPVYVKQQYRDDEVGTASNSSSPRRVSTPKASIVRAYDDLQRKKEHRHDDITSMAPSPVSSLVDISSPSQPTQQQPFSLSMVLSEVTEEDFARNTVPRTTARTSNHHHHLMNIHDETTTQTSTTTDEIQHHSVLQLCTEDLMNDDIRIVRLALQRLLQVCSETTAMIQLTQVGGHGILVGVMKKFHSDAVCLASACQLIRMLVANSAFAELFLAVAGLETILRLLEFKQGNDDNVHANAAKALTQLLQSNANVVERFLQMGKTQLYLRTVQQQRLATNGILCRLLYQLSTNTTGTTTNHGTTTSTATTQNHAAAVDLIVAELNQCPDSRSVQVYGCATLGNIFKRNPEYGNEGIPAILRAMKLFSNDEIVLERAITGLYYCLPRHVETLKHQSGGCLSTVSLALECFPKNAVIQSRGSAIIKTLLLASSSPHKSNSGSKADSHKSSSSH